MVRKSKTTKKLLSIFLVVLMLIATVPAGILNTFAATTFTIKVTDEKSGNPIENADISIVTKIDNAETEIINDTDLKTDSNGIISFSEINDYISTNTDKVISLEYKISADDYVSAEDVYEITSSNIENELEVKLKSNPMITVNGGEQGTHIEVDGVNVGTSKKVPAGTEVNVIVTEKENCFIVLDKTAKYVNGNKYTFEVTEDLEVNVTYEPITYTINLTVDNGEVQPSKDGKITVTKTAEETEITFVPDEHYHLDKFLFDNEDRTTSVVDNKYIIDNSKINDDSHNITAQFAIDTFKVESSYVSNRGSVEITGPENLDLDNVPYGTDLTATITPKNDYALVNVTNNGADVAEEEIIPVENTNQYEYKFVVDKDMNIFFDFSEVVVLDNVNINDVISVSNSIYSTDGNFYVKDGKSAIISLDKKIEYTDENNQQEILENNGIICYRHNNSNQDAFINTSLFNRTITVEESDILTKIQFKSDGIIYQINGNINVLFDSVEPKIFDITNVTSANEFTNEEKTINFSVEDETQSYNSIDYASGVNYKSIKVTRSYANKNNEPVEVDTNECSFEFVPVENYTGDITYKISVADNVGNKSEKTFVVSNDTDAPKLVGGNNAVEFKIENDNVFAHVLNKISRGKWLNEQMTVQVSATDDSGVGFGNDKSIVQIALVNEDGTVYTSGKANINSDGNSEVLLNNISENGVFKGSIYYNISDGLSNGYKELNESTVTTDWTLLTTENTTSFEEGNIVMIEENKPVISDITASSLNDVIIPFEDNSYICNGDAEFKFKITDDFSGLYSYVAKINGNKVLSKSEIVNGVDGQYELLDTGELIVNTKGIEAGDDCSYVLTVEAVDYSGNVAETKSCTIYKDTVAPVINVDDFEFEGKNHSSAYGDVAVAPYGFYFKEATTVKISANDIVAEKELASGVASINVYLQDVDGTIYVVPENGSTIQPAENNSPLDAVDILTEDYIEFTIPENFKGQIYAKATDKVQNTPVDYVHPDGSIIESSDKHADTSSIDFVNVPKAQGTQNNTFSYSYSGDAQKDEKMDYDESKNVPLYNNDITFGVKVTDTYSGINEVTYTIIEGENTTVKSVSLDNNGKFVGDAAGWTVTKNDDNLVTEITNNIAVSGNYNDMVLLVELTDRAGNKSYDYYAFGIDKTAPIITVTYNNNNADTQSGTGAYFDANRTATILVQERNFNTQNVKFTLKNAEGSVPNIVDKGLVVKDTKGNGDGNIYQYEVSYTSDGVYTFDVAYTDRATNVASVDYKDSVAPKSFVIDKTMPTISVSFDNNEAQNGKYFKAHRTATITVVEHNFDVNRVTITQTASLAGRAVSTPSVSWVNSGDVHVATINYNSDADYTFDITMTDKAGNKENTVNYGSSVAAKEFTVDTTYSDIVKVEGVANGDIFGLRNDGTINDEAEIKITFNDVNFDKYSIHLYRNRVLIDGVSQNAATGDEYDEKDVITTTNKNAVENDQDVTDEFVGRVASGNANTTVTFDIPAVDKNKVKNDGIYTLKIEANDKAGNVYNTDSNVITFCVNRYGSVYTVDDDLYNLINTNDGYTQSISGEIIIREYNTTDVTTNELAIYRGTDQVNGVDCKPVKVTEQGVEWNEYVYKVDRKYFMDGENYIDGEYSIVISSQDKAKIKSTNDKYDTCKVDFVIDTTAPKINGIIPSAETKDIILGNYLEIASSEDVTFTVPVTDNLRLSKIEIWIGDTSDGATPSYTYTYTGDDKIKVSGKLTGTFDEQTRFDDCFFTLSPDTTRQDFRIKVTDKVGLTIDTADFESGKVAPDFEGFFSEVLITSNWFVRMWNRPVFKIALGAFVIAGVASVVIIVVNNRRKSNKEAE